MNIFYAAITIFSCIAYNAHGAQQPCLTLMSTLEPNQKNSSLASIGKIIFGQRLVIKNKEIAEYFARKTLENVLSLERAAHNLIPELNYTITSVDCTTQAEKTDTLKTCLALMLYKKPNKQPNKQPNKKANKKRSLHIISLNTEISEKALNQFKGLNVVQYFMNKNKPMLAVLFHNELKPLFNQPDRIISFLTKSFNRQPFHVKPFNNESFHKSKSIIPVDAESFYEKLFNAQYFNPKFFYKKPFYRQLFNERTTAYTELFRYCLYFFYRRSNVDLVKSTLSFLKCFQFNPKGSFKVSACSIPTQSSIMKEDLVVIPAPTVFNENRLLLKYSLCANGKKALCSESYFSREETAQDKDNKRFCIGAGCLGLNALGLYALYKTASWGFLS